MSDLMFPEIAEALSEDDIAAVWRFLTKHNALDLAEMLGLFE